jgi:hypothetical protein
MTKEILTTWAHVKLTLGVDPTKYIHVLVPCESDSDPHLDYRFSTTASPSAMCANWSISYRGLPVSGLELIFDRDCQQLIDLIDIVKKSMRGLIDTRVVIIPSDDGLLDWLCGGEGRHVCWEAPLPTKGNDRRHLLVKVSHRVDSEDENGNEN